MLTITIPGIETYNSETEEFVYFSPRTITLEHSLLSISKWESKWCIPYIGIKTHTTAQTLDYVRCMTLESNIPDDVYHRLTVHNIEDIRNYIDSPMTATVIQSKQPQHSNERITSELIYYWMISCNIPFEAQKWHINRLLKLINVCNIKNSPGKKMKPEEIMAQNAKLNAERRALHNSTG